MGLATRIARRIGIHRDGSDHNLSAWTTEMRRRTWRVLRVLDIKALESYGIEPDTYFFQSDTALPQNNSDSSWDPCEYAPRAPAPKSGFTEMTFAIVQSELSTILQSLLNDEQPLFADVKSYVDYHGPRLQHEEDRIQDKYLQSLDMYDPIQRITSQNKALNFHKFFVIVHQPLLKLPYKEGEVSQKLKDRKVCWIQTDDQSLY